MNLETAERLMKLRKQKGYSQEELADKLGISRQAVSKWERAEASPDTDNLIELSKLYGVSLDELLGLNINKEKTKKDTEKEETKEDSNDHDYVHISLNGIHVKDKDGSEVNFGPGGIHIKEGDENEEYEFEDIDYRYKSIRVVASSVFFVLLCAALIVYLLVGFKHTEFYKVGWLLFFVPIIVDSIFQCIMKRDVKHFSYPLFITAIYLFIGLVYGIWHPTWVLFITIPVFYSIPEIIRHNKIDKTKHKVKGAINIDFTEKNEDDEN